MGFYSLGNGVSFFFEMEFGRWGFEDGWPPCIDCDYRLQQMNSERDERASKQASEKEDGV